MTIAIGSAILGTHEGVILMQTTCPNTGFLEQSVVKDLLKECIKMSTLDHPNVLTLIGVCMDGGPAPYIVMPFMFNGSLLAHLKKERENLVILPNQQEERDTVSLAASKIIILITIACMLLFFPDCHICKAVGHEFTSSQRNGVLGQQKINPQRFGCEELHVSSLHVS